MFNFPLFYFYQSWFVIRIRKIRFPLQVTVVVLLRSNSNLRKATFISVQNLYVYIWCLMQNLDKKGLQQIKSSGEKFLKSYNAIIKTVCTILVLYNNDKSFALSFVSEISLGL